MSGWRRLYAKPAGSLPGGVVTQWGVGILALLVLGFLTGWIYLGGGADAELAPGTEPEQQAARSFQDRMAGPLAKAQPFRPPIRERRRSNRRLTRLGR